jgi:hypothetical protein
MPRTSHTTVSPGVSAALTMMALAGCLVYAEIPARVPAILQGLGLTTADYGAIARGRPVSKSLRAGDRREVAAGGAIRIPVPAEFFLQRFVDIVSFKQSRFVTQIGKFGGIPQVDDLSRLTLDAGEIDELKTCRPGDCGLQLSTDQIRRMQNAVDWSSPGARAEASRVMRELLFDYVERYRAYGNQALIEYANEKTPVRLADEWRLLVNHSAGILASVPEFSNALLNETSSLLNAHEFLYWSKEQFGLKPVVSITHVTIYLPGRADAPDVIIASKQIYASRYLAASLGLTLGVEGAEPQPSLYLAYANRTRSRAFPPVIGALARRVAQGRAKDGLEEQLALTKQRLESAFAGSGQ